MNIFNILRCLFMALYLLTKVLISLTEFGRALLSCSLPHIVKLYNGCNADRAGSCWLKYSDIHSGKTDVPLYLFDGKQLFSKSIYVFSTLLCIDFHYIPYSTFMAFFRIPGIYYDWTCFVAWYRNIRFPFRISFLFLLLNKRLWNI